MGGDQAAEADPRVLFHNLPLKFVMGWLWENAEARQSFVVSWHLLRDRSRGWGARESWRNVRGEVPRIGFVLPGMGSVQDISIVV